MNVMDALASVAVFAAVALVGLVGYKLKIYYNKWIERCPSCGALDTKLTKRIIDDDRERVTLTRMCNACSHQHEYKALRNSDGY